MCRNTPVPEECILDFNNLTFRVKTDTSDGYFSKEEQKQDQWGGNYSGDSKNGQ